MAEEKYMGYKLDDLSESLQDALGKSEETPPKQLSYLNQLTLIIANINWNNWTPSLHTTMIILYFLLLAALTLGISTFMWKKYGIKPKSQSQHQSLENQLLGTGKYAQYVNSAIAFKIYKEEMAKMEEEEDQNNNPDDSGDDDTEDEEKRNDDDKVINESALIGGYYKSNHRRLRARTVRKQKIREQREAYEQYRKRLEYEKKLKRHNKMKEKKENKKMMKRSKKQTHRNEENQWFGASVVYNSIVSIFEKKSDKNDQNETHAIADENEVKFEENVVQNERKLKTERMREHKRNFSRMIIDDLQKMVVVDLAEYYRKKVEVSENYGKIFKNMKAMKRSLKNLMVKHEECKGMIDDDANLYFRWNQECERELAQWIQVNGKCGVKETGAEMLEISKKMFL